MKYGLQLYSVRDIAEKDFEDALRKVSAQGYKFVETAGFFGRTAEQFNALMEETGLQVIGSHEGLDPLVKDYENVVAFHKAIGNKNYIIPGHSFETQAEIDDFIAKVNEVQPKLEADGITLSFHNHAKEFLPNKDGSVAMEQIINRTNLKLEVDIYWVFVGLKGSPIPFLERVQDRLILVHMKDGTLRYEGTPLGRGEAPVAEVYKWVVDHNIPMVVESGSCTPDGLTEVQICIDYLRSLED